MYLFLGEINLVIHPKPLQIITSRLHFIPQLAARHIRLDLM